jgi:4-amino-4-deoxy-L-arabinose transferase-like glycosyltransferase
VNKLKGGVPPPLGRIVLLAILLVAAVLRLAALDRAPPGPSYDELQNARLSERVLEGRWAIYYAENFGQEPLYPALAALAVRLFGWSVSALRLPGALAGILSVIVVYRVGRRLHTERAALLAAAFQAVSFWSLIETRVALEIALLPPLSATAMLLLVRGLDEHERGRWHTMLNFGLAGALLGAHVYAYTAGRVMPFLPLALLVYLTLLAPHQVRRHWLGLLLLCLVTALVVAPLAVFLRTHPDAEQRLEQLVGPLESLREGDPRPVLRIAVGTLGMFTFQGEPQWLYNIAERPVFDPVTSILFYAGLAWCIAHLRDWRYGLVLLWLLVGLSPAMVSPPAGSFTHSLAAQPAVYLALGLGGDAAWRWLSRRRAWLGPALLVAVVALHFALSRYAYFGVWRTAPEVSQLYQGGVTAIARELDASTPPGPVAAGGPYVNHWHPWNAVGFDLALRREDLQVRWFNPSRAWIWPHGAGPITYYFPSDPLGEQTFDPVLQRRFTADAASISSPSDDFLALRVSSLGTLREQLEGASRTPVAWLPAEGHERRLAPPVRFGDRIELLGADVPEASLVPGGELRVTTYWRVLNDDASPVVAFVHLTSDGRDIWGQHDGLDVWPPSLRPGDRFAQVHPVPVRSDAPTGPYRVEVGLYHPETLQRLQVVVGEEQVMDHIWIGDEVWIGD